MNNIPNKEEVVDILGSIDVLKIESERIEISLDKHNQINIQPKETPIGLKIEVDSSSNIIPTITFDTKKIKESKKEINSKEIIDNAIEKYLNE